MNQTKTDRVMELDPKMEFDPIMELDPKTEFDSILELSSIMESDPAAAFYFLDDVVLIVDEENPESAERIMEAAAADLQKSGWSVLRTPIGAYIAFCPGMEYHFLPCRDGYALKAYSDGEAALNYDVFQYLPEHE